MAKKTVYSRYRGFTLLELVIVTIIVGSLAGIAVPNFFRARERTLQRQAMVNVRAIAAGERANFLDTRAYLDCVCNNVGAGAGGCDRPVNGCNTRFKLNLSAREWQYSATLGGGAFQVLATRINPATGCTYTLNGALTDDDPAPSAGCI